MATDKVVDINIHDTYIIIAYSHFSTFFSIIFILIGFIYWITKKYKLYNALTRFHIYLTIGSFIFYMIGLLYYNVFKFDSKFPLFDDFSNENTFTGIILLLFTLAQLIFILNIISSTVKHIIQRRRFNS